MDHLNELIGSIPELDPEAMVMAQQRQDQLTKPQGSLGVLEDLSIRLAGIAGAFKPSLGKKVVIVMAGDHGVADEGVSAFPAEVTPQMVANFCAGGAAVNVLSRHVGAEVRIVDMGVASAIDFDQVVDRKIGFGTANMTKGPAMTREEALAALMTGVEAVNDEIDAGATIIAIGDMGIGNTTAATAILAAITGTDVEDITGRGTGIDDAGLRAKRAAVINALSINKPDAGDPIDVLSKVGGYEIGGIAGVILGAAAAGVPVVIDGFISGAAALIAAKLAPKSINYMIASHVSAEPGHKVMLREIGLEPMLTMNMRLGEGTGALLAVSLVDAACKIINEMATFGEAQVSERDIETENVTESIE